MSANYPGGCICQTTRYCLDAIPRNAAFCHCESCRRSSGAAFVPWGTVDLNAFHVTKGTVAVARTSPGVERGFCRECGSSLTYWNKGRAGEIDVVLVSLDDVALVSPKSHIWVEDKLPWVRICDGLPQFEKLEGFS